jgi:hypothetical protein
MMTLTDDDLIKALESSDDADEVYKALSDPDYDPEEEDDDD